MSLLPSLGQSNSSTNLLHNDDLHHSGSQEIATNSGGLFHEGNDGNIFLDHTSLPTTLSQQMNDKEIQNMNIFAKESDIQEMQIRVPSFPENENSIAQPISSTSPSSSSSSSTSASTSVSPSIVNSSTLDVSVNFESDQTLPNPFTVENEKSHQYEQSQHHKFGGLLLKKKKIRPSVSPPPESSSSSPTANSSIPLHPIGPTSPKTRIMGISDFSEVSGSSINANIVSGFGIDDGSKQKPDDYSPLGQFLLLFFFSSFSFLDFLAFLDFFSFQLVVDTGNSRVRTLSAPITPVLAGQEVIEDDEQSDSFIVRKVYFLLPS